MNLVALTEVSTIALTVQSGLCGLVVKAVDGGPKSPRFKSSLLLEVKKNITEPFSVSVLILARSLLYCV